MTQDKPTLLELLTFEELEIMENIVGKEYVEIFSKGLSARATYTLHWILEQRRNPEAKIEDSKKLSLGVMNDYITKFIDDPKAS